MSPLHLLVNQMEQTLGARVAQEKAERAVALTPETEALFMPPTAMNPAVQTSPNIPRPAMVQGDVITQLMYLYAPRIR